MSDAPHDYTEAQERENVRLARWSILHNGKVLPVTNLYDSDAESTMDAMLACAAVAYDRDATDGKWIALGNLDPGDIWIRTNAEAQSTYEAGHSTR